MSRIAIALVILSGLGHLYITYVEVFDSARLADELAGMKLTLLPEESGFDAFRKGIVALIQNQGIYNAFIGAGLLLSFLQTANAAWQTRVYGAACILLAGLFGGMTVSTTIYGQAALGGLTLAFLLMTRPQRQVGEI
ncbi:MAG: DUF1304 domain-containing protein [Pseudomonadota bacterium]